ncbi:hypothetical protein [Flavobacterium sp. GCM10023249]|uniref:hypothetical protein n=1 Tax=unclassified Flavobacterium TaxID=196869 RepID=UPI00360D5A61
MNFSDFKKINQDLHLTSKELRLVTGGDNGLVAAYTGWNLSLVTVHPQQTNTNDLGAAAMLSDSQVSFTVTGTSSGLVAHDTAHLVGTKGTTNP